MKTLLVMLMALLCVAPAHADEGVAEKLYGMSFPTLSGENYSLEQQRGRVLLINFWATWCPPCVREMPALDRLDRAFSAAPFEVIAISAGEDAEAVEAFRSRFGESLQLQFLLDPSGRTFREFELRGLPMSYLFDHQGQLVEVVTGEEEWDSGAWQSRIQALVDAVE